MIINDNLKISSILGCFPQGLVSLVVKPLSVELPGRKIVSSIDPFLNDLRPMIFGSKHGSVEFCPSCGASFDHKPRNNRLSSSHSWSLHGTVEAYENDSCHYLALDQYLYIPFLGG